MRRAVLTLALTGLVAGCPPPRSQQAQPPQPPPNYGYYPNAPQQPWPQQPSPQRPSPYPQQPYPQQPAPKPTAPPAPAPTTPPAQPAPAPSNNPNATNPWLATLNHILQGGAPPWPPPQQPPPPTQPTPPTTPPPPSTPAISPRALELANAINAYRAKNGLAAIPISKSLSFVAETHANDLRTSPKVAPECNGHSWSSRGSWTPCCYTSDHAQAKCMWGKPAELTPLKGTGFEITIGQPGEIAQGFVLDANKALASWQSSPLHNDVILNRGQWTSTTWKAMGAGIVDSHACAWFSDSADPVH